MRRLLHIALLGVFALVPLGAGNSLAQAKKPECFCTDKAGARVELGQTICLIVDGRASMALCRMSQNSPMWQRLDQACLSSSLGERETLKIL